MLRVAKLAGAGLVAVYLFLLGIALLPALPWWAILLALGFWFTWGRRVFRRSGEYVDIDGLGPVDRGGY